jgi:hypothetical protein
LRTGLRPLSPHRWRTKVELHGPSAPSRSPFHPSRIQVLRDMYWSQPPNGQGGVIFNDEEANMEDFAHHFARAESGKSQQVGSPCQTLTRIPGACGTRDEGDSPACWREGSREKE